MLCGVTATLGSNPSATATAARPHWGRAVLLCLPDLWARSLGVPVGGGPPARSPHASLKARSGRSRGPPWPCRHPPAPRPGPAADHGYRSQARASKPGRASPPPTGTAADPSGALHTSGAWCVDGWLGASARCPARPHRRPPISHVIPLRLVQTLNLHRWNCNVCGVSRKMTTINYVRNLGGGGVVAARGRRRQARGLFEAAPPGI